MHERDLMSDQLKRTRLQTEAIVIGYAMSRLDTTYLSARKCLTWNQVFAEAADALRVRPGSLKNLRDEFDPIHGTLAKAGTRGCYALIVSECWTSYGK
jgi:hypothetical protein